MKIELKRQPTAKQKAIKATGVFLLAMLLAFIPTVCSYEFFIYTGSTDLSALALAGCVGFLAGMITAAIFQ